MHKITLAVLTAWLFTFSCADRPATSKNKLRWMTLAEARTALEKEKRPLLIDVYTDWCTWCKVMDRQTYANEKVIDYLQSHFYPVKLNAETREALEWGNRHYGFDEGYKANTFAVYLTHGQLAFPTTVIIPVGDEPQPVPGYLKPAELEPIVKYFGDGHYGKTPFEAWQKGFRPEW